MMRPSFGRLLIGVNVGLVVAAVLGVAVLSLGLLRRLADDQSLARVRQAGASATQAIEASVVEMGATAHLLGERPTLAPIVKAREVRALGDFLNRFLVSGRLTACAVVIDQRALATGGASLPWEEIARATGVGDRFLLRPGEKGPLLIGASTGVTGAGEAAVYVARALDADFSLELRREIGLPVTIAPLPEALDEDDQRSLARGRAVDSEQAVVERLDGDGIYLATAPLRSPKGDVIGVVDATLPTTGTAESLRRFVRSLVILSFVVAGIAALSSILVGRRLVRPLEALTEASSRIGLGDLATPIPHAEGDEIGTLATAMEEMRGRLLHLMAEGRRRHAEAEAIVTGIVEGVFAVDRTRRIRYLNPQAAALLRIRPEQALGRFCGDVLNPRGPDGVRPCEERCPILDARFRGSARATEHLVLPGGEVRSVVITSASPDAGDTGESPGALALPEGTRQFQVIRDETESEVTRRLRDTVLANITHEFRTPLSAQLASIELLRDRLSDPANREARDLVASLERGTLRLTQLIDNLLESVRIDAGQDSIRRQPVALDEVVDEAVDLTAPLIALRDQRLVVELPYPLPPITGDAPRLVQVFVNLIANASKFAPAGTTIGIGGKAERNRVTLWVEDEGPGLPPGADATLFERFMRSPGEEPEESGMGLGLWIVKSIVERHGGSVEARRAARGGDGGREGAGGAEPGGAEPGTRMCVTLPAGEAA
jgi:signal transduction histidine kinase